MVASIVSFICELMVIELEYAAMIMRITSAAAMTGTNVANIRERILLNPISFLLSGLSPKAVTFNVFKSAYTFSIN